MIKAMTTSPPEFRNFRTIFVLTLFGLISLFSPVAFAADQKGKVKPYPLNYCIVDGKPLGDHPTSFVYKGQEIKVDEPGCKEVFMQDPDLNLKKVQEAARKHKKAPAKG
jgi:hypothetical protein